MAFKTDSLLFTECSQIIDENKHLQSQRECQGKLGHLFSPIQMLIHSCLYSIEHSYACCPHISINSDSLHPQTYLSLDNKLHGPSTQIALYYGMSVSTVLKTCELRGDQELNGIKSWDPFLLEFRTFKRSCRHSEPLSSQAIPDDSQGCGKVGVWVTDTAVMLLLGICSY